MPTLTQDSIFTLIDNFTTKSAQELLEGVPSSLITIESETADEVDETAPQGELRPHMFYKKINTLCDADPEVDEVRWGLILELKPEYYSYSFLLGYRLEIKPEVRSVDKIPAVLLALITVPDIPWRTPWCGVKAEEMWWALQLLREQTKLTDKGRHVLRHLP